MITCLKANVLVLHVASNAPDCAINASGHYRGFAAADRRKYHSKRNRGVRKGSQLRFLRSNRSPPESRRRGGALLPTSRPG
jgi:hypothetical protein